MASHPTRIARALALMVGLVVVSLLASGAGCGAKTGLLVPQREADAAIDAPQQKPLACGTFSIRGQLASLDLFITMDTSGSMSEETAGGIQKIDAVVTALGGFLKDPASAGIGVAISLFPSLSPFQQEVCSNDVACGEQGACEALSTCYPSGGSFCSTNAECPAGETCERVGLCGTILLESCVVDVVPCEGGALCLPAGWCKNSPACDPASYLPLVAPQVLPQGAASVLALLENQEPQGATPTAPALRGGIQAAIDNSAKNPTHKSIVLLATDGFPSSCPPIGWLGQQTSAGIPMVVDAAKTGTAGGVQTFVIGVFTETEAAIAQQNLDAIAQAGGTETAYIIKTNQPVSEQLVKALNDIRVAATGCDYALPRPDGEPLDGKLIKVKLTGPFGERWLERRGSLAECDPVSGGYVFDKDPFGPEPPARVQLCPASCALVRSDPGIEIEVSVECSDAAVR